MRELETDVIVVGGGASGLAAAISAAEKGANVIVLEKANTTGGCANMAMGLLGVETKPQKELLIGITREHAFTIWNTHWRSDAKLIKFIDLSADTIDWLMDMGVRSYPPAISRFRSHLAHHQTPDRQVGLRARLP